MTWACIGVLFAISAWQWWRITECRDGIDEIRRSRRTARELLERHRDQNTP